MASLSSLLKPLDSQVHRSKEALPKNSHFIYVINGQKGSGKSTLLLNLLGLDQFYRKHFDNIFLVSPTANNDPKFSKLINELNDDNKYYSKCEEKTLLEIIERIESFNGGFKKRKKQPRNLLILDDCLADIPKSTQKSSLHRLVTTSRHLKLSIIITSQKFKALNTLIRCNCDVVSFFTRHNDGEKRSFCEEYSVNEEVLDAICQDNNDFLTVSFSSGKKVLFDKLDEI
jgi:predicted AAA+ superfamily ATPase